MTEEHGAEVAPGRDINFKLILLGVLGVLLGVFAVVNTHEVGVDWVVDTVSAPMIVVILASALLGFLIGFLVRGHLAGRRN
jgi:uncharacterized integral membrane protein